MSEQTMTREERDQLILSLRNEGLSLSEVGKRVGLSGTRVSRILNGIGTPLNPEGMSTSRATLPPKVEHRCATPGCGRSLKDQHWIYSSFTGDRYCWTGEGCWNWSEKKRREMRAAHVAPKPEVIEV